MGVDTNLNVFEVREVRSPTVSVVEVFAIN